MAKRIEYIEPIGAIRGDLSASQRLAYAEHNNDAYYSPVGKRNQARNYKPRYIGMKDANTGRTRYAVRDKYTINMTANAKKAMAYLAGTAAIYAALLKNNQYQRSIECWQWHKNQGLIPSTTTYRRFWVDNISPMVTAESQSQSFLYGTSQGITISNIFASSTALMSVNEKTLVKFFDQLNSQSCVFFIDNLQGIASTGMTFIDLINSNWNVLGLTIVSSTHADFVQWGGLYLKGPLGHYVLVEDTIVANRKYTRTAIAP